MINNKINLNCLPNRLWRIQCTLDSQCSRQYCSFYHNNNEKELGYIISILITQYDDHIPSNDQISQCFGNNTDNNNISNQNDGFQLNESQSTNVIDLFIYLFTDYFCSWSF